MRSDHRIEHPGPRRTFLDTLLGIGFVSTVVAIVYPVWRYLIPPATGEPATDSVVAAKAADVKPDSGLIFRFGSKPGLLVRTRDGEFRAFSAICTHLDCTVQYKADTSQIWCACHNGLYDLAGKGDALLQGLLMCGTCNRWMRTEYWGREGVARTAHYVCRRQDGWGNETHRLRFPARIIEAQVVFQVLQNLSAIDTDTARAVIDAARVDHGLQKRRSIWF